MAHKYVSMARDPEKVDEMRGIPAMGAKITKPVYNPMLSLTLREEEIEALKLDVSQVKRDQIIPVCCLGKVTRVISAGDEHGGDSIHIQIIGVDCGHEEAESDAEEAEERTEARRSRFYSTVDGEAA
jgi:hypothetical protein